MFLFLFSNQIFVGDFSKTSGPIYMKLLDLIENDLNLILKEGVTSGLETFTIKRFWEGQLVQG